MTDLVLLQASNYDWSRIITGLALWLISYYYRPRIITDLALLQVSNGRTAYVPWEWSMGAVSSQNHF